MKKAVLLSFFSLLILGNQISFGQELKINFRDPQTWLLGNFESDDLLTEPHKSWFDNEFDSYELDSEAFIELAGLNLDEVEVLIVLGTWCPDSRREVPRFIKVTQLLGMNQEGIKLMGTDSYKEAPVDGYQDLNIERVPTFIFYHNKNEIGRIIEYPKASLERDMVNIFSEIKE